MLKLISLKAFLLTNGPKKRPSARKLNRAHGPKIVWTSDLMSEDIRKGIDYYQDVICS